MPRAKPTLGYPSRTAAVLAMRGEGMTMAAIAERIGISVQTVSALEHSAHWRRGTSGQQRTVVFPVEVLDQLIRPAADRGIGANELARRIVEAVVDDGLIDAVLDDGGTA